MTPFGAPSRRRRFDVIAAGARMSRAGRPAVNGGEQRGTGYDRSRRPEQWHVDDQPHHPHLLVLPVEATDRGPAFSPVSTAFERPDGETRPCVHVMFEQDTVVD